MPNNEEIKYSATHSDAHTAVTGAQSDNLDPSSTINPDTEKTSMLHSIKLHCIALYQNWNNDRPERLQRRQERRERRLQRRQELQQLRLQYQLTHRNHFSVGPAINIFVVTMLLCLFGGELLKDYPAIHWFAESCLRLVEALFALLKDALEWAFANHDANLSTLYELFGEPVGNIIHNFFEWCRGIFGM